MIPLIFLRSITGTIKVSHVPAEHHSYQQSIAANPGVSQIRPEHHRYQQSSAGTTLISREQLERHRYRHQSTRRYGTNRASQVPVVEHLRYRQPLHHRSEQSYLRNHYTSTGNTRSSQVPLKFPRNHQSITGITRA
jgi:hypothetical protein